PPETRGPWLAGGGSTIRGIPENNSIQPFLSANYNGKKGTMAGMADGSVRFIPENISQKVFQHLCVVDKTGASTAGMEETLLVPRQVGGPELKTPAAAFVPPAIGGAKPQTAAEPKTPTEAPPPAAAAAAVNWQIFNSKADRF